MRIVSTLFTIALIAGCHQPGDTYYVTEEGDVYEGDQVTHNYYGDTEDTAEPTAELKISFTTALGSQGTTSASPSEKVNFGGFLFQAAISDPELEIAIDRFPVALAMRVSTDTDAPFYGGNLRQFTEQCKLEVWPSIVTIMGPIDPEGDAIDFDDTYYMKDGDAFIANVLCYTLSGEWEVPFDMAIDVPNTGDVEIAVVKETETEIIDVTDEVNVKVDIGNWNGLPYPSRYVHLPYEEPEAPVCDGGISDLPIAEVATDSLYLNSASPGGMSVPGWQEVLRFNWSADPMATERELTKLVVNVFTTDNANTDWDDDFGGRQLVLYNMSTDGLTPVMSGFANPDCRIDPWIFVLEGATELPPPGQAYTYTVWADTTGASGYADDAVQVLLENSNAITTDIATGAEERPLTDRVHGSTIMY